MKILEIIPSLISGGAERFVVDLSNEISKRKNCEVILVILDKIDDNSELGFYKKDLDPNIKLIELNKKLGFDFKTIIKIHKLIKSEKPDIVHSHLRSLPYLLLSMVLNHKIKYFHTVHNDAEKEASDIFNRIARKFAFKLNLSLPITISDESDHSFTKYYGNNIKKTKIYNGSPLKHNDPLSAPEIINEKKLGQTCLVSVARVHPQKNQKNLVAAVSKIPNVSLFLLGNNSSEYAKEIMENKPKNVYFLGTRSNPRDYMAASDAFILPSLYEGMPISLIECFSTGTIPLVSNVGGMKNMVKNNYNGLLFENIDEKSIQKTILYFLTLSAEKKKFMESKSFESFSQYDIKTCADNYIEIFKSI